MQGVTIAPTKLPHEIPDMKIRKKYTTEGARMLFFAL